jgi:hypothetical protein
MGLGVVFMLIVAGLTLRFLPDRDRRDAEQIRVAEWDAAVERGQVASPSS